MVHRTSVFGFAFIVLVCLLTPANAGVLRFDFSQDGYEEGASLMGTFVGEDTSGDGQLAFFPGGPMGFDEITEFTMEFSGNSLVAPFTADLGDLFGLVYDINFGPVIGDGMTGAVEGIGVNVLPIGIQFSTGSGPGPFPGGQISVPGRVTTTQNNAIVTQRPVVPEPSSLAVWGMLAVVCAGAQRRRR